LDLTFLNIVALRNGPFWGVRGDIETARLLLERGAAYDLVLAAALGDLERVRHFLDEDYRSTPLAWAARNDLPDMVELLLAHGAATNLPDDEPWATPLAWATRRGHGRIAEILRPAGATARPRAASFLSHLSAATESASAGSGRSARRPPVRTGQLPGAPAHEPVA